jgi:ABC-type glycerol-3-phosphate transport system permease component
MSSYTLGRRITQGHKPGENPWSVSRMVALLAALPLVVVFLFFQRQIIKGIATTGFGGSKAELVQ